VGHSYGGFVITNAAIGRTDVGGLVYTAAYVPDTGETINSLSVGYTPGRFWHTWYSPPRSPSSSSTRNTSPRTSPRT
jgi:pimeloyl-ACP methyl ester carboxylesterase